MRTVSEDIDDIAHDPDRAQDNGNNDQKIEEAHHWETTSRPQPSDPHHLDSQANPNERPNSSAQILEKVREDIKNQSINEALTDLLMTCNEPIKYWDLKHDQSESNLEDSEIFQEAEQNG